MEREILLTGIGGQSVQLAAGVLARAAVREERHVLLLGTYGGTMRGGSTASTLVVGDAPLTSPPIVSRCWAAVAMHHAFWPDTGPKVREGGLVVVNGSLFEADLDRRRHRVFEVAATRIAAGLGAPLAASLVLAAAFAGLTGLVGLESLILAMRESVPAYRRQHLEANAEALRAGFGCLDAGGVPAWPAERAA